MFRKKNKQIFEKTLQFIKFGIVGFTNNIIFYIVNIFVLWLLSNKKKEWDYVVANVVSFFISVLWSFYLNRKFVFKATSYEKSNIWTDLIKTYISYSFTGVVLNNILSYVWISIFDISKLIAPLINIFITFPVNYLLNKLWVFKVTKKKSND